ncbi:A24 family peptidase [Rhodococcus sp. 1163]|uniref:prepilin peptidase n=1 Tax=Rhodococcus sp. 1163 TaxID=1905289 RepID=UPI000A06470C|nr:A24 family peptidase [Rhodococcus sp. 1163]
MTTSSLGWALAFGSIGWGVGLVTERTVTELAPSWKAVGLPLALGAVWSAGSLLGCGITLGLLSWWCSVLACIDVGCRRLPNPLTGAGAFVVLLLGAFSGDIAPMLVGAAALFGSYLLVHVCLPMAFGAGDVKLAWPLGGVAAMAGLDTWALVAILPPLLTGLVGVTMTALGRRDCTVPHGPSMCVSTLLALAAAPT